MAKKAGYFSAFVLAVIFLFESILAAEAKPPILIGGTVSMTGRFVEPSAMGHKGFQLWVRDINQQGGILGRRVKLIIHDDKSDPGLVGKLYKKLITDNKVDLLISPYSTPLTLAASEVSEKYKKVMLAYGAAAEKPWQRGFRYLFQIYAPANRQFIGLLDCTLELFLIHGRANGGQPLSFFSLTFLHKGMVRCQDESCAVGVV